MASSSNVEQQSSTAVSSCKDGRVLNIIFSRSNPISELELRDYFTSTYGNDVIEDINMEVVPLEMKPLFATVTFRSKATVDAILLAGNESTVQIVINGKLVSAKLFFPRPRAEDDDGILHLLS